MSRRALWLCALLPVAAAAAPVPEDPVQVFEQLEAKLLAARRITIEGTVSASGALPSGLRGRTELGERNRLALAWSGRFNGKAADLALESDNRVRTLRNGADTRQELVDAEANRAVVLGLTRMGLLHNLARLTALHGPDHGDGGAATWVVAEGFNPATYVMDGPLEGAMALGFDVVVGGKVSGTARLWLDGTTGLPRRREQSVRLGAGEIRVVEDYERFEVQ